MLAQAEHRVPTAHERVARRALVDLNPVVSVTRAAHEQAERRVLVVMVPVALRQLAVRGKQGVRPRPVGLAPPVALWPPVVPLVSLQQRADQVHTMQGVRA